MKSKTSWWLVSVGLMVAAINGSRAQQSTSPTKSATPEALKAEIEALRPARLAWREIAWKSCLLEGLQESRVQKKPMILWVFIDRPADDARC